MNEWQRHIWWSICVGIIIGELGSIWMRLGEIINILTKIAK